MHQAIFELIESKSPHAENAYLVDTGTTSGKVLGKYLNHGIPIWDRPSDEQDLYDRTVRKVLSCDFDPDAPYDEPRNKYPSTTVKEPLHSLRVSVGTHRMGLRKPRLG